MTSTLQHVFANFDSQSKVWIYTSSRAFTMKEADEISQLLDDFSRSWTSHGSQVKGAALLLHGRFVLFIADEKASGVSGCSIDKTMAVVRSISETYSTNLLDRFLISYKVDDQVNTVSLAHFKEKIASSEYANNIKIFNNTISCVSDLAHWEIPYCDSPYYRIEAPLNFI